MICAQARPLLGAHLDNELDVRSSLELEAHLRDCVACRAELADLRTLQESARANLTRFAPSPAFEARLASALRPSGPPRRAWLTGAGMTLAAAALLFVFLRLGDRPVRNLGDEIADAHARSLLADHATDVQSSDQHTVKPWFNGKSILSPQVVDLSAQGYPLVGGRIDVIRNAAVPVVVYNRRLHVIDVWALPPVLVAGVGTRARTAIGYNLLPFKAHGVSYVAASDLAADELAAFTTLLQAEK
jgi:anti-sigma factor RsiW